MKRIIVFFFIVFFFLSCQKELEINLPQFEQKPVVSCLFTPDSLFKVRITKTIAINDSVETIIENAECIILSNNVFLDTLQYIGNGFYISDIYPQKGSEYTLKVNIPGYETLTASSNVPDSMVTFFIQQKDFAVADNENFDGDENFPYSKFSITINDLVDKKNFYEFSLALKRFWNDSLTDRLSFTYLFSYSNLVINEDILDYKPYIIVLNDTFFNGQSPQIDFLYHPSWITGGGDENGNITWSYGKYRIYYTYRNLSPEMYMYRKSLIKHLYNQQSDEITVFGDPVQMWSNIENGYGIFAGYLNKQDSIFIERTEFNF